MNIADVLNSKKVSLSFEVFPPKKKENLDSIKQTACSLTELNPDFISVTYGAMGSTTKRTLEIAKYIKNEKNVEALAHLTGINTTHEEVIELCLEDSVRESQKSDDL